MGWRVGRLAGRSVGGWLRGCGLAGGLAGGLASGWVVEISASLCARQASAAASSVFCQSVFLEYGAAGHRVTAISSTPVWKALRR